MNTIQDENREVVMTFRVNKNEFNWIDNRFKMSGLKSRGEFIRRTVILSKIVNIDGEQFKFLRKQITGACTNINQIAYNTNRKKYADTEDFEALKSVNSTLNEILFSLNNFENELRSKIWQ
jgi:hypothetical protein